MKGEEFKLQRFVVECLQKFSRPGVIFYHCPNGEKRAIQTGKRLKAMGVRPGVADLCLVLPGGASAFLELKKPGGITSEVQEIFRNDCREAGAGYAVADTPEAAVAALLRWGVLTKDPLSGRRAA